jgi:Fur family ferric uptake transcriptional regulator
LARKKHKGIGYATVARTVKLMCESGVCRQVDFGDGSQRFEHKYGHEHHDHLICLKCGKFEEIYSARLEKIQDELVRRHGYVQENHKLDIFGLCPRCAKKRRK